MNVHEVVVLLGVQIEPAAMKRPATEIAHRIMACNDVAYLKGQLAIRADTIWPTNAGEGLFGFFCFGLVGMCLLLGY